MPSRSSVLLLPILILAVAGCSSSPLPPVERVAEIRLTLSRMPDEKIAPAAPRFINIKAQADIAEVMAWLNSIDWSQSGTDMAVIRIQSPDGGFMLINKNAQTHNYNFYWDGKFVHTRDNRLIRGGDMAQLQIIVERLAKK